MRLTSAYSVAVYHAEYCTFYESSTAPALARLDPFFSQDIRPDSHQLALIQSTIVTRRKNKPTRLIVLVPDAWLSTSQCQIDHLVPVSLLPLAALSYAVETTFLPPETLSFSFQQHSLPNQFAELAIFACSNEWRKQLCEPFKRPSHPCLLIPFSQWNSMPERSRSWSQCQKKALATYQPDKPQRRVNRLLWWSLLMASVLINGSASAYFLTLQQQSAQTLIERQQILNQQTTWSSSRVDHPFIETLLAMVQSLPRSVRIVSMTHVDANATLLMTLPQQVLTDLLNQWQSQTPTWQWRIESTVVSASNRTEVVDVSIHVFEP